MSSLISGSTGSTASTAATQNGRYWGLASGLDVDSIVTALVSKQQAQIDKANQSKQTIQWQQSAYQSIMGDMNTFRDTYLDIAGTGSIVSSRAFAVYTATSDNAAISVNANADVTAGSHSFTVTQSAVAGSLTGSQISSATAGSGAAATPATLDGTSFNITIDGVSKTITFKASDASTNDADGLATALQKEINTVFTGSNGSGTDKVSVTQTNGIITVASSTNYQSVINVTSNTGNVIAGTASFSSIQNNSTLTTDDKAHAFKSLFSGSNFNITVNGTTKNISFSDTDFDTATGYTDMASLIQSKITAVFADEKVKVSFDANGAINFQSNGTKAPNIMVTTGSGNNALSILGIKNGTGFTDTLTGLGITSGASNRVDASKTLNDIFGSSAITADANGNFAVSINGTGIALNVNDSLSKTLLKINGSDAGVTASYSTTTGKVSITSNKTGASTTIQTSDGGNSGFFTALLGSSPTSVNGLDAIFKLDGTSYSRASNTFTIDNITYTINNKITTSDTPASANIDLTGDVSSTVKSIQTFVDAYNKLVTSLYTQITTKPDANYQPLTDTQKSSMKDTDITVWNQKAQAGILFSDSTISSMLDSMTDMLYQPVTTSTGSTIALYQIGITTSPDYSKGNILTVDTDKLTKALQDNPNSVKELFTKSSSTLYSVNGGAAQINRKQEEGLGYKLQDIINDATKTGVYPYVGSLVQIAGTASNKSTDFELNKKLSDLSDKITGYNTQLKTKKDQLYSKFSKLESLMQQMNSQSSMISSFASSGS